MTATISLGIGVSAVIGLQGARQWYSVYDLKESIPELNFPHDVEAVRGLQLRVCDAAD